MNLENQANTKEAITNSGKLRSHRRQKISHCILGLKCYQYRHLSVNSEYPSDPNCGTLYWETRRRMYKHVSLLVAGEGSVLVST